MALTTTMLEGRGYIVLAAHIPGEASVSHGSASARFTWLTDVVMPEMNGRDLARNLLKLHTHLHRLFMSGCEPGSSRSRTGYPLSAESSTKSNLACRR